MAEAARNGEDATKGWALPRRPQLFFRAGPGDRTGPDDDMSVVIISTIKWLFKEFIEIIIMKGSNYSKFSIYGRVCRLNG